MPSGKTGFPDLVQNASVPLFLSCPVCHEQLTNLGSLYQCASGHTFDIAKQGYVNLLLAHQRKSKQPGDNKEMILSRTRFLEQGYYQPISDKVNEVAMASLMTCEGSDSGRILDVGCGEGYYLTRLYEALTSHPLDQEPFHHLVGLDISKVAIREATRRSKHMTWVVASVASLPLLDASCSLQLNIFAPINVSEFTRVLEPLGKLILVTPGPSHLSELRTLLYEEVRENTQEDVLDRTRTSFTVVQSEHVTFDISLKNTADLQNLYRMTPFFWKSSPEAHLRVEQLDTLQTHADVFVRTLQKRP